MNPIEAFHAGVRHWFEATFEGPTPTQHEAWTAIRKGTDTLISAPTGSGKTLAAFLSAINDLVEAASVGQLRDETRVLYVSPLKALSNDIHKNLEAPLAGILDQLAIEGVLGSEIRTRVRTGDTTQRERAEITRNPPHILVTTPESLYILLTSEGGRRVLGTVRTVIVDEIHALVQSKRGAHLALSLERLDRLTGHRAQRIGLSATQNPIEQVADFLTGTRPCTIIQQGHLRSLDLSIEVPDLPLEAVLSGDQSQQIYDRMQGLIEVHRSTLIFVNTRRQAERVARGLTERLGPDAVTSHHGSLSKDQRLEAEHRLKQGDLKALVATASLELGIDVGAVDLVLQLGSPRSIATFLQRIGRSGHYLGGTPKGRLFPTTRDDLIECVALIDAVSRGELDVLRIPSQPLDVLAQQIVAMIAAEDFDEDDLYRIVKAAYPYHALEPSQFEAVIEMLATGYATSRGQRSAYLYRDRIHRQLKARKGARLTAVTCGGAIPDNADYRVILEPQGEFIGTVDEDFAIESMRGDIFQLGNASWRVLKLDLGNLRVEDAKGLPPSIPFWFGEAPGRTRELSVAISRLRTELMASFDQDPSQGKGGAVEALHQRLNLPRGVLQQAVAYLQIAYQTLRALPTFECIILERFFDEAGGMQLIIHSPFGNRVNRAWGLALRKRFCRSFNFELQAAATEEAVLLSLGTGQSFDLGSVARYLSSENVRTILVQALLDAPMFTARWRWNAVCALAIRRFQGGRKTPPYLVRMQSEDLVTSIFPDQLACLENIVGDRKIPDHPLVNQTLEDCLMDAMDIEHLEAVLAGIEKGTIRVEVRDLREPSPLAAEIVNARAYSFLDGAPLEERRTRAVVSRRWLDVSEADDLSVIPEEGIREVVQQHWPSLSTLDETHDALMTLGYLTRNEVDADAITHLQCLMNSHRAFHVSLNQAKFWVASEHYGWLSPLIHDATLSLVIEPQGLETILPETLIAADPLPDIGIMHLIRSRMSLTGPVSAAGLSEQLGLPLNTIQAALLGLEGEGTLIQGRFTGCVEDEWCDRRILSRIHRTRIRSDRQATVAVGVDRFMRFLFRWHHLTAEDRLEGAQGLNAILDQLEGFEAPAKCWENDILSSRMTHYDPTWLDQLCLSGQRVWSRFRTGHLGTSPIRTTPIGFSHRREYRYWQLQAVEPSLDRLSSSATMVLEGLTSAGPQFFDEIIERCGLLPTQGEQALAELVTRGWVYSDGFAGLRALIVPEQRRQKYRNYDFGLDQAGRWNVSRPRSEKEEANLQEQAPERVVRALLRRYGVLFRALLENESLAPAWSDLLPILRRLELRGEVRGGRFVVGDFGEQFALPEAAASLEAKEAADQDPLLVVINACDPLALEGVLTDGAKVPRLATNRILYRNGQRIGHRIGQVITLNEPEHPDAWVYQNLVSRDSRAR